MTQIKEQKIMKRRYVKSGVYMETEEGYFINTGKWADGHLVYSRCDQNGNIIEEGEYLQIRGVVGNGNKYINCLYMLHI